MTVNKRSRISRMRGSHTHGWGSMKKHRGSGNRGGKGMAGTGKRADHKKPTILKLYGNAYFGKHGFNRPQKLVVRYKSINLSALQSRLEKFVNDKLVIKQGEFYVIDADKLGYGKILGGGELTVKLKLKARFITGKAASKIKEVGGVIESENDNIN